jgi:hypothetical protein
LERLLKDREELADPPHLQVGHQELHLPAVPLRREEERQEHVGVGVEVVARVPTVREQQRRHIVPHRALIAGAGERRRGAHRDVADEAHGVGVHLARVRLDAPLLGLRRADQGDRAVGAVDAHVAVQLAPVDAPVRRQVAQRLPLPPRRRRQLRTLIIPHIKNTLIVS